MKRKKIVIISVLDKILKKENGFEYQFHFIGYFRGVNLSGICLQSSKKLEFEIGLEYILHAYFAGFQNSKINVKLINSESVFPKGF